MPMVFLIVLHDGSNFGWFQDAQHLWLNAATNHGRASTVNLSCDLLLYWLIFVLNITSVLRLFELNIAHHRELHQIWG